MVTDPDRVVLIGSRSILARVGEEKKGVPLPSSTGRICTRVLVDEPALLALAGNVCPEDLEVLAVGGFPGRGDGSRDVAGEEGDCRVLHWPCVRDPNRTDHRPSPSGFCRPQACGMA